MSGDDKTYSVQQGDTIAKIAKAQGFKHWRTIYEDTKNAKLKEERPDPNVLYPGDKVFIPEKSTKRESGSDKTRHRFRLKAEKSWLRIILRDADNKPLKDTSYGLEVGDLLFEGYTNGKGLLEHEIPCDADAGLLRVTGWEFPLRIGHLDPVDEISGWQARLHNLGYRPGPVDGAEQNEDGSVREDLQSAVEEFQFDHGLVVDGRVGPKTQEKLKKEHGC